MNSPHTLVQLAARSLSRPVFGALSKGKRTPWIPAFAAQAGLGADVDTASVLGRAYDVLAASYRNEYVYKSAIADRIVFGRHSPRTTSLSVELGVGKSILDIAVFNGAATAYEVKTTLDTPRRLATQSPDYLKAFDKVYLVTHPDLVARYAAACDERVGVLALSERGSLSEFRAAEVNSPNTDKRTQFRMLRRSEYVPALEREIGKAIELPNGVIAQHCEDLFLSLPTEVTARIFLAALKSRGTAPAIADFVSALPPHLRVLGYETPLSRPQRARILSTLKTRVGCL